ncbi:MAG: biotin transporter BioY [Rickettsiales bacterium]|jgi:biotin transport system substrate-specific component|nr:biotin transporter BioY [Rickettsiales bacterium]
MEIVKINTAYKSIIKLFFASFFLAIFAQIYIPLPFVPITGQTLSIILLSLLLGRKSIYAVLLYLAEGSLGLPFFTRWNGGLSVIMGPTGGYLIGFIFSSFIIGYFADKGHLNSSYKVFLASCLGMIVIYSFGILRLSFFIPRENLLKVGLLPFIIGDMVKILIATCLYNKYGAKIRNWYFNG